MPLLTRSGSIRHNELTSFFIFYELQLKFIQTVLSPHNYQVPYEIIINENILALPSRTLQKQILGGNNHEVGITAVIDQEWQMELRTLKKEIYRLSSLQEDNMSYPSPDLRLK